MNTIIGICAIAILAALVFNAYMFHRFKNCKLEDKHYWELKYEYQFLTALFGVVIAVISFLGFSTYSDIKSRVKEQVDGIIAERFESKIDQVGKKIKDSDDFMNRIQKSQMALGDKLVDVDSIFPIYGAKVNNEEKIYFKDLTTPSGKRLPVFKKPPLCFAQEVRDPKSESIPLGQSFGIVEITKDYIWMINSTTRIYNLLIVTNL